VSAISFIELDATVFKLPSLSFVGSELNQPCIAKTSAVLNFSPVFSLYAFSILVKKSLVEY